MDSIKKYYKVCDIKPKSKQPNPVINQIDQKVINVVFTKKQVFMYLTRDTSNNNVRITVKESIVGGGKKRNSERVLVIG